MDASDHETAGPDIFVYVAIFVLVTWPVTLILGLVDSFLVDDPADKSNLVSLALGVAVGALVVLIVAGRERYRRHKAEAPIESRLDQTSSQTSCFVICPNCGYEGPSVVDSKARKVCPWCEHRFAPALITHGVDESTSAANMDRPDQPSERAWYFSRNGEPEEMISFRKLKRLVSLGRLQPTDKIWRNGMPEWRTIGELPGLFPEAGNGSHRNGKTASAHDSDHSRRGEKPTTVAQIGSPVNTPRRSSNDDEWYYISAEDDQPFGPVSFAELRARAGSRQLRPTDLVLANGSEWTAARFVANLFRDMRK